MMIRPLRAAGHDVAWLCSGLPSDSHPQDEAVDFFREPRRARERVESLARDFRPDWILQVDESTPLIHLGLERFDIPKAWYAVDSHLHGDWYGHYACMFDRVFCAQKNTLSGLGKFRPEPTWLPLYFAVDPAFLPWSARAHDFSFVGTLDRALNPARCDFIEELQRRGFALNCKRGDYVPEYRASKAVVNQSARDDLNFRFFEAMGCGALLITDRLTHSLEEIGEPGRDFLVYAPGDVDDFMKKADWVLGHPREAEAMARRGYDKVVASHLPQHRVAALAEVLERGRTPAPPRPEILAHLAYVHQHVSRLRVPADLAAFFAAEAGRLARESLRDAPGSPWACLAVALLGLEAGEFASALRCLEEARPVSGDPEYRRSYLLAKAMLLAHGGRLGEARRAAGDGLVEFSGDADFFKLLQVLMGTKAGPG